MDNFIKLEKKILKIWQKNKIFEKSIKQRKKAANFVFYEGPPTANAQPGLHHVLARVFKDIICRYKTMAGFKIQRKAGWDTHGLPVELQIEKKLGLKLKKDIERYGITKFNKKCKESVWEYKKEWEKLTERIGFWLDMKNPYITYQSDYIETVWWILKQIWQKGLLEQDYQASPYCPRCQTILSSHEIAQGYKKIKEPAIYVKFPILNSEFKATSLLIWTTTPWTLPGNVAIAVNPEFTYVKIRIKEDYLILAKERLKACNIEGEIVGEFKGKDLFGLKYSPLFPVKNYRILEHDSKIYEVIGGDFVSLKEGTGLVHIAPAFGEEDMELIKTQNLSEFPILITVDEEGRFKLEVEKFAGMFVKEADPKIIEDLKKRDLLFKEELYEHDYPFCWRCNSPLIYYAKKSWFIRMTKVKKDLIKNNQKINWAPGYLKEGRFGEWLKEVKDWALSRERYWGTPLPVWLCQCNNIIVVGSKDDLLKQKFSTNQYFILRHGQTIYQTKKNNKVYPYPEKKPIGLTTEGIKEVQKAAHRLKKEKIDLIYSSDFYRAKQTAQIVAQELNLKINFDKRLREINLGIYHGQPKEKYFQEFPITEERFDKKPPKGESWLQCQKRMVKFLSEINKKNQNKKILIIGHGDTFWLLEGAMKGKTKKELIEMKKKGTIIKTGNIRKLEFKVLPFNEKMEMDFHKPYIDEVKFYCQKCGGLMQRIPEVIDCWFDSGAMPFGQAHWPFAWLQPQISNLKTQNYKKLIKKILFPADYISEGIDQTRGWFYTLLAISTLLNFGSPYKNVISLGHVLDEKGEKMSKSKGNVVDPWYITEKYGADAVRWYFYTINQPWDSKLFSEKDVEESFKKFILIFWNSFVFYKTYRKNLKLKTPSTRKTSAELKTENLLDKWILSKLNRLIQETTQKLDRYDITGAARGIENFVINDLSLWYIRRSRSRFQKPKTEKELKEASQVLRFVLLILSKLTAPFIPFLSEEIYQEIQNSTSTNFQWTEQSSPAIFQKDETAEKLKIQNSVHLENWPKPDKKLINKKLERKMEKTREIVSQVLAERAKAKIKVRQPLNELRIRNYELRKEKELLDLIKEEVNVKNIIFDKTFRLNTEITPELKKEGIIREIIRNIQEARKKAYLKPKDKILIQCFGELNLNKILEENKKNILKEVIGGKLEIGQKDKKVFDFEQKIKIDQENLWFGIKKLP